MALELIKIIESKDFSTLKDYCTEKVDSIIENLIESKKKNYFKSLGKEDEKEDKGESDPDKDGDNDKDDENPDNDKKDEMDESIPEKGNSGVEETDPGPKKPKWKKAYQQPKATTGYVST